MPCLALRVRRLIVKWKQQSFNLTSDYCQQRAFEKKHFFAAKDAKDAKNAKEIFIIILSETNGW